ncbi:MAG: sugar transferase [Ruminococcaceae bacterium]|nr:sugar transferase [Oscillospiraceae bacterium]
MYKHFFKRFIDFVVALCGLPFLAIIFIALAPLIYFEDRGPVFYNAPRRGKDGKIFKMYKFRSMKVNSPDIKNKDGSTYNGENDPRVTKIGRILRKTSLDETPQLLNILKGDMSIIGPRPVLARKPLSEINPDRVKCFEMRPGLTGYSQAYFRNSITSDEKLLNDLYYVKNVTFFMDIKIFFQTATSVLKRKNIFVTQDIKSAEEKAAL